MPGSGEMVTGLAVAAAMEAWTPSGEGTRAPGEVTAAGEEEEPPQAESTAASRATQANGPPMRRSAVRRMGAALIVSEGRPGS